MKIPCIVAKNARVKFRKLQRMILVWKINLGINNWKVKGRNMVMGKKARDFRKRKGEVRNNEREKIL